MWAPQPRSRRVSRALRDDAVVVLVEWDVHDPGGAWIDLQMLVMAG